jgi:hypothetical protein
MSYTMRDHFSDEKTLTAAFVALEMLSFSVYAPTSWPTTGKGWFLV